jgi:hypothetical protein
MSAHADGRPIRLGVFTTTHQATQAIDRLLAAGFSHRQISVLCSNEVKEEFFKDFSNPPLPEERLPGAIVTGATIGAVLGGLITLGVTMAAGINLAAGPVAMAIFGAIVGGLIGAMMTRGGTREIADYYDQAVTHGRILVSVEDRGKGNASRLAQAEQILAEAGAEPVPLTPS